MKSQQTRREFLREELRLAGMFTAASIGLVPISGQTALAQKQRGSGNPDSDAIACFMNDDTQCAVDIWEEQFRRHPFDDVVRDSLHLSLLAHTLRCLDKGKLAGARTAFSRAKEVVSYTEAHAYFEEALRLYDAVIGLVPMTGAEYSVSEDSDLESRYVEIPALFGGQAKVFALTLKNPGMIYWYEVLMPKAPSGIRGDFVLRFLAYPMSANGSIVAVFGQQDSNNYFQVDFGWRNSYSAEWLVGQVESGEWTYQSQAGYVSLEQKKWHTVEVRVRGNTVELWVDMTLVGSEVVLSYKPGGVGFGGSLSEHSASGTFSVAFDDIAVYTLAK